MQIDQCQSNPSNSTRRCLFSLFERIYASVAVAQPTSMDPFGGKKKEKATRQANAPMKMVRRSFLAAHSIRFWISERRAVVGTAARLDMIDAGERERE